MRRTILKVGGPMFEPIKHDGFKKVPSTGNGAHYSIYYLDAGENDRHDAEVGMQSLRSLFPNGEANDLNFVLFSTSGVHGSYVTLEEIAECIAKYGDDFEPEGEYPDDFCGYNLTVVIVHPRIVCLRCGNVRVRASDIPYLEKLRATSKAACMEFFP